MFSKKRGLLSYWASSQKWFLLVFGEADNNSVLIFACVFGWQCWHQWLLCEDEPAHLYVVSVQSTTLAPGASGPVLPLSVLGLSLCPCVPGLTPLTTSYVIGSECLQLCISQQHPTLLVLRCFRQLDVVLNSAKRALWSFPTNKLNVVFMFSVSYQHAKCESLKSNRCVGCISLLLEKSF